MKVKELLDVIQLHPGTSNSPTEIKCVTGEDGFVNIVQARVIGQNPTLVLYTERRGFIKDRRKEQ